MRNKFTFSINRLCKPSSFLWTTAHLLAMTLYFTGCSAVRDDGVYFALNEPLLTEETEETNLPPSVKEPVTVNPATETASISTDIPTDLPTEAPAEDSLSLIMVGDVLLHTPVEESCKTEDGTYDYSDLFANTGTLIQQADLALVNQEVIIGGKDLGISGYPAFNAPYEMADALADTGFDVICHATNHALDKGKRGLVNCLTYWEEHYPQMVVLGIHQSKEEQDNLFIYEQNGIRIAILNYTYGTNGISLPEDMPFGVDLLQEEFVISQIKEAEELADFTIVCPHWGTEYRLSPDKAQEKWAGLFAKNGVDLVIGTHPHVIEPVEWVYDEATGHEMLVYYSLGNFVNWTSSVGEGIANRMVGGMAQVTLKRSEETDNVVIDDYGVKALVCHLEEGPGGVTTYTLSQYATDLAEKNAIRLQDSAFSYEYCVNLCDQVWGELWD